MLTFLGESDWTWNGCASLVASVIGSVTITFAFWPGFYQTWKTKDTKFLPLGLFALFLLVGILMTAGSIAGACVDKLGTWMYVRSGFFIYLNSFVMLVNAYIVGLALWNRRKDKKQVNNTDSEEEVVPLVAPNTQ
ncbi:hypothetical protein [Mycoplasma wenyonii]|nr:hypothetical protein [Mycoplasma wenyonii]